MNNVDRKGTEYAASQTRPMSEGLGNSVSWASLATLTPYSTIKLNP